MMKPRTRKHRKNPHSGDSELVPHRVNVIRGPYMAPETEVTIPFSIANQFSATSATFATQAYKINSLADANINYVGLSNFNGFYTKYRIIGVKAHFDFLGYGQTTHFLGAATFSPVSTAIASAADVLSAGVMPNSCGATVGWATGTSIERRRMACNFVGIAGTEEVLTSDSYSAATSAVADPADLIYLHICSRALTGTSQTQNFGYVVRGHLRVRYFERKTAA